MTTVQKNIQKIALLTIAFCIIVPHRLSAHCEIPCGIYDDYARIQSMREDVATIEKAMVSMSELTGKTDIQSKNQLVRWIMNKEQYAQKIITTISDYFLTQRVKPTQKDYPERLRKHHSVILAAMNVKQNTDLKYTKLLQESIEALAPYYPEHTHEKNVPKKSVGK